MIVQALYRKHLINTFVSKKVKVEVLTNFSDESETFTEFVLQMLRASKTFELSVHHNSKSSAKSLTFFHAMRGKRGVKHGSILKTVNISCYARKKQFEGNGKHFIF